MIIECFENIKVQIRELDELQTVNVYGDIEYADHTRPICKSSIGRELLYAYDHAVHHLAIVKLGIHAEFPGIELDDSMGVASSTLRYQQSLS